MFIHLDCVCASRGYYFQMFGKHKNIRTKKLLSGKQIMRCSTHKCDRRTLQSKPLTKSLGSRDSMNMSSGREFFMSFSTIKEIIKLPNHFPSHHQCYARFRYSRITRQHRIGFPGARENFWLCKKPISPHRELWSIVRMWRYFVFFFFHSFSDNGMPLYHSSQL